MTSAMNQIVVLAKPQPQLPTKPEPMEIPLQFIERVTRISQRKGWLDASTAKQGIWKCKFTTDQIRNIFLCLHAIGYGEVQYTTKLLWRVRETDVIPVPMATPLEEVLPPENEMLQLLNDVFDFEGNKVRVVGSPEQPEFIASDVCEILGIANSRDALSRLEDYQKGVGITDTLGGVQEIATVTEAGLYELTVKSRKPAAKKFKRWLFKTVLPSIRRTGSYKGKEAKQEVEIDLPILSPTKAAIQSSQVTERLTALESELAQIKDRLEAVGIIE